MSPVRGFSVAVLGIDGVGKTTVVAAIRDAVERPVRLIKVGIHSGRDAERRSVIRRGIRWLGRTLHGARVLLSAHLAVRRGEIVLWDRHPIEDRVTMGMGRRVMGRGRGWLARLAPSPDVMIVLDAPPEHVAQRRPDDDPGNLSAMREGYLRLAESVPSVVIDARQTRTEVRDEVLRTLARHEAEIDAGEPRS